MFRLSEKPIDAAALGAELNGPASGALVVFEGRVRNHNLGRGVERLEYEAGEVLCAAEAARIEAEARARFDVTLIGAVHRVGRLEIGEMAIWIGVASAHREAGFAACRFLIDEYKRRLPIWKKEHYAEGAPEWAGAAPAVRVEGELSALDRGLYERQMRLPGFGDAAQLKLKNATVLVVGAGGLGSPALQSLAASGVGRIVVCDGDQVALSNLHRQILYTPGDVGRSKARAAVERLTAMAPHNRFEAIEAPLGANNARELIAGADVALDCADNFATRFLLHDACWELGRPLVQAAVHGFEGQLTTFDPAGGPGCLRCLYPEAPDDMQPEAGVFGPLTAMLGAWQAAEAVGILAGLGGELTRETLLVNCRGARRIKRPVREGCGICGERDEKE